MRKHHPRKRFGQHFLANQHVLSAIVAAIAPQPTDTIVEIGPGLGAMTHLLIGSCQEFIAIELDRDLYHSLTKKLPNARLYNQDVLKFNWQQLNELQPLRIVGNLPYNISTPLLFKLFENLELIQDMHFLLQYEVVARLTANPHSKQYGRLSVMAQYFCDMQMLFEVDASAFNPPPQVQSAVVRMIPKKPDLLHAISIDSLTETVKMAFAHRRKTLANNLKPLFSSEALTAININPKARAEELDVADFVKISNTIHNLK
jgi:16S rRNA (adenine1518-N6/adenine1519-N6)-dimethyltransferase